MHFSKGGANIRYMFYQIIIEMFILLDVQFFLRLFAFCCCLVASIFLILISLPTFYYFLFNLAVGEEREPSTYEGLSLMLVCEKRV